MNTEKKTKLLLVLTMSLLGITECLWAAEPSSELIYAIGRVESSGNINAVGDRQLKFQAYGLLQIRQPCVDDVNRRYRSDFRAEQCLGNEKVSTDIFRQYVGMYATRARLGHEPTDEDRARIWNGGPNGWKSPATVKYWVKVKRELDRHQPTTSSKKHT